MTGKFAVWSLVFGQSSIFLYNTTRFQDNKGEFSELKLFIVLAYGYGDLAKLALHLKKTLVVGVESILLHLALYIFTALNLRAAHNTYLAQLYH